MEGINSSSGSRIDLDRLPIKRLDAIDEFGNEQFPPDVGREEKRLSMIRRIDFSFVVDRDSKRQKKEKEKEKEKASSSKDSAAAPQQTWPWQGLVENLQLAHQELSVIMDLISTVEANDFVAVAGMQRPKQLPNEVIADLAVSAAAKFQRLRQVGRYFKQSSKVMEQKISKEMRFYSSLIRLQQNWKVKRLRLISTAPNREGFTFDLQDNVFPDLTVFSRSSSLRTIQVDRDAAGYLAIQKPQKSGHSISVTFLGNNSSHEQRKFSKKNVSHFNENTQANKNEVLTEADKCVRDTHSILREIHHSIFVEQVFDMVNREVYNPSTGISVTGMQEDLLKLAVGQDTSICVNLVPSGKEYDAQIIDSCEHSPYENSSILHSDSLASTMTAEKNNLHELNSSHVVNPISLEVYLLNIFHENALIRSKDRYIFATRSEAPTQLSDNSGGLLGHFCKTLAHRVFSNKVLSELESLVSRVPYIDFLSHPTMHSRTSSWSLSLKVPQSVIHASGQSIFPESHASQFHTKIVVKDDQISVSSEGAPTIGGSSRGTPAGACSVNCYGCDLEDFSMILLQQIAGQVIRWLHEEALVVGMRANRDFLCLHFDLDQGDTLDLVAHVDPNDINGCISWWMILDDGLMEEKMYSADNLEHGNHQYLGHLSLESLYSMILDVVSLCSTSKSR